MKADADKPYRNLVNGAWIDASDGAVIENRNPADTSDIVSRHAAATADDAKAAVDAAAAAFPAWRDTPIGKRAAILERAAAYLDANADQFGHELAREEGKLLALGVGEVKRAAQTLRFYAIEGQTLTGETYPQDDPAMLVYSHREPLGVATAITPWNFPISIPARKIAPALITGNAVVFKPSSEAPLIALRLVEAFVEAGIPAGVLNLVIGPSSATGPAITADPRVRSVSFTGSTGAGEKIHRSLPITTRSQMELGGKNPLIVLADADLDTAAQLAVAGGFSLTGQACTGTSRVLVESSVKDAFIEKLAAKAAALKVGNGLDDGTKVGPLASAAQLKNVLDYIAIGKGEATLVAGGNQLTGGAYDKGYFVEPTVFADVSADARIAQEEIFGPVISVIEVADYDEAIAVANGVQYGLSAALVTNDFRYIQRFPHDVEAGTVKVNRTTTGNLVNAPFGGVKMSSTATFRESGRAGLDFFTQIKTVYLGR
ncbi:aldehyde dehydrogenase family protein [Oceanibium sediminis]|uniref:aldehyde dehydrogenase family protein n=1 Tax=Oceanibium sediminis TaxID=2026339 RepID=UPI000DD45EC0|nr:aldehyde dehydrogenase family protein [Oceanibium sediminis]